MSNKLPIKKHLVKLNRILNSSHIDQSYLRLEKNENLVPFSDDFMQEIYQALTTDFISSYPELGTLYNSIAAWTGQEKDSLYLTAGSDAAIKMVFEAFVEPGDNIAILHPTYAMYYVYAKIFQVNLFQIECQENLSFSVDEILGCLKNNNLKLFCLANPNSPTGTTIRPDQLELIIKTANENSVIILIDEAYYLYYPESAAQLIDKYPNLVITRTFSKALGFASARLGFALGNKEMISALNKVRPMYEVNALGAKLVEVLLQHPEIIDKNVSLTMAGKKYLESELDKMNLPYFKSYGNFVLIDVGSFEKSAKIVMEMRARKILIKGSFSHQHLKHCIRVTAGPEKQMALFLTALRDILGKLSP